MGTAMSTVISKDIEPLHEGMMISIQAQIPSRAKRIPGMLTVDSRNVDSFLSLACLISRECRPEDEDTPKHMLHLHLKTSSNFRFSIDLVRSDESVAFHFNPRFDDTPKVVVCNTWTPWWLWWKEDRFTTVPFSPDKSFVMTITVRSSCYEVFVDGKHFLNFDHRIPYHTVRKVNFRGDVIPENFSYTSVKDPPHCNAHVNTTATYPPPYNPSVNTTTMDPPPYNPSVNTATTQPKS